MMSVYGKVYREFGAGGYTRVNGTVQFFGRVNALLEPDMAIVDLGAGRGGASESTIRICRELTNLRGKVAHVIGIDVDPVVKENQMVDEAIVFDGVRMPIPAGTIDLVVADNVFEHLPNPQTTASDLYRVLKPGGWVCARTPHRFSLLAIVASVIPNRLHPRLLSHIQPGVREAKDVFPTLYRVNSARALRRYFPPGQWENFSYTWSPEPAYNFGSPLMVRVLRVIQYIKSPLCGEMLLIFLRKK